MVWAKRPGDPWIHLPWFFTEELPAGGPGGLWLQADGCCGRASWVELEVTPAGNVFLNRGWQAFARARGLVGRRTLHFKYDGAAMLYIKVFREDGRLLGCCPEDDGGDGDHPSNGDGGDGLDSELALSGGREFFSSRGTSSGQSSSDDNYSEPPRHDAWTREDDEAPHRRAPVEEEDNSD